MVLAVLDPVSAARLFFSHALTNRSVVLCPISYITCSEPAVHRDEEFIHRDGLCLKLYLSTCSARTSLGK